MHVHGLKLQMLTVTSSHQRLPVASYVHISQVVAWDAHPLAPPGGLLCVPPPAVALLSPSHPPLTFPPALFHQHLLSSMCALTHSTAIRVRSRVFVHSGSKSVKMS